MAVTRGNQTLDDAGVFIGDSEMARRCREVDWASTALGPASDWSRALRTAVRTILECPFAVNLWCGDEYILIYNDRYRALLGAKHPAALARRGDEVWAEIWPEIGPMFDQIRSGGPCVYAENARFAMERATGPADDAWFTFSLSPLRDEDGEIIAMVNVAAETTSRVRAEAAGERARLAAERTEHRLREIFVRAPAFLAVLSGPTHVFEFANDAYDQLVGHRELLGRRLADALPEVVDQGFITILDRVLATGEAFEGREVSIVLERTPGAGPEECFVDFVYQPIFDEAGAANGVIVHGSNITGAVVARRDVERLLRESEQTKSDVMASEARYRFLANAIPVQVWTATPDGALDYVSDRTATYFGKTTQQVVGEQWVGVLHPDDVARTTERWLQSLATGEPYEVEFRLWSAAHSAYRWHLGRAMAQRNETGEIIRWFGTNTDIEEWKRAEAELQRLTHDAMEANRAKGDFLAAMSHELRTPLNAIGGYAQLIEMGVRGPVTEAQRIDLLKIKRSKDHLDSLVSDVLSFAKLGAGRIDFRVASVGVAAAIESVLEMTAPQFQQKPLELTTSSVPRDLCVAADQDKVRQILLNLLGNALKFTPAYGMVTIAVATSERFVDVAVSDTGIGISDDQLEHIFEPFVQAGRSLPPADAGVGLGLAISRQLARAMSGDLTVTSGVEKGSAFTLRLPRCPCA